MIAIDAFISFSLHYHFWLIFIIYLSFHFSAIFDVIII